MCIVLVDRKRRGREREREREEETRYDTSITFPLDRKGDGRRLLYHIREGKKLRAKES
jgi:hypothetical protein